MIWRDDCEICNFSTLSDSQELLRCTPETCADYESLLRAQPKIEELVQIVNEGTRQLGEQEKTAALLAKIVDLPPVGDNCRNMGISGSQCRGICGGFCILTN